MLKSFLDPKAIYREQAKSLRAEFAVRHPLAARHAAAHFMSRLVPEAATTVAVYYPTGSEIDTKPLVDALHAAGCKLALPVVAQKAAPLLFRSYTPGDALINGQYGIARPADTAPQTSPSIIVCPLLAYKTSGARLGMGGGYYDRTFAALRRKRQITAVGYGFSCQEMPTFPVDKHDQPLDWIVTEQGAIKVR